MSLFGNHVFSSRLGIQKRKVAFLANWKQASLNGFFAFVVTYIFCNIKPFESKIHVCVVLNCTILLPALGIPVYFELSDDFVLFKADVEEMLCLYSCLPCSGASSWSPCAASTISWKLWKRTMYYLLLFPDGLSQSYSLALGKSSVSARQCDLGLLDSWQIVRSLLTPGQYFLCQNGVTRNESFLQNKKERKKIHI